MPHRIEVPQETIFPDKDSLAHYCIVHHQVLYIEGLESTTISDAFAIPDSDDFNKLKKLWEVEQELLAADTTDKVETPIDDDDATQLTSRIVEWTMGFSAFSGILSSFLAPHSTFYIEIISARFPDFPETPEYTSWIAMQELLGALLFDADRPDLRILGIMPHPECPRR